MKLMVTGAAGFVGAAVVRAAYLEGHEVVATIRPGGSTARIADLEDTITVSPLDLKDSPQVQAVTARHKPDVIVHVAWSGVENKARFERSQIWDNIESSCALVDAAIECGVQKFVGIGSQGEYGPLNKAINELQLPQPTTLYGAAKLSAYYLTQQLAAQGAISHSWLRIFSTYGPNDNPGWLIPMLIREMLSGRRPKCTLGTQYWDYLYIDDLARGILAAATIPSAHGLFNIGSGRPIQVKTIVETIRDFIAPDMPLVFGEIPFRPDQVMLMEADIGNLTKATGWKPTVDIETGLKNTIEWYRANSPGLSG
jgi:nucleoside-diphosphate-sugar epimerase